MSLLERLASKILTTYLGEYIEGLDSENLSLNLSKGDVVLSNLRFKKSALQDIELPVVVKEGLLGKLSLQIPWSSLGSKPVIVRLEKIFVLLGPKSQLNTTPEEEQTRALKTKKKRLQLAEVLGFDKPDDPTEAQKALEQQQQQPKKKDDGFFSRLIMKVIDNLQIFVDKVHIRYEDDVSNPNIPFSFGFTLEHIHAQSTDEWWKPTFLNVGQDVVHKLVTLKNFAIYWNTGSHSQFLKYKSVEELGSLLDSLIHQEASHAKPNNHYLLAPVSGFLKATIDRGPFQINRPKITLNFDVNSIALGLDSRQYQSLVAILDYFSLYVQGLKYLRFKSLTMNDPKKRKPQMLWNFALSCVISDIREKKKTWTWNYITQNKKYRQQYVTLYKKKKKLGEDKLTKEEKAQLETMEAELSYENIIIFRKIANTLLMKEQQLEKEKKSKQSFFGRLFGTGGGTTPSGQEIKEEDVWKEVYTAIGYSEKEEEPKTTYPKEYVKTKVQATIERGSFEMCDPNTRIPIIRAWLSNFSVDTSLREESLSVGVNLETVNVTDFYTLKGTPLEVLKPDRETKESFKRGEVAIEIMENLPLMSIQFDLKPPVNSGPHVDVRLKLRTQPLLITFSRPLIDRIAQFFTVQSSSALQDLAFLASNQLDAITKRAQERLKYALEHRKIVQLDLDLRAPTIVIPESFDKEKSSAIIVDLGRMIVQSDPTAWQKEVEYKEGMNISEDYFYDTFELRLTEIHALLTDSTKNWRTMKASKLAKAQLIDRFDVRFTLKLCNVPTPQLPKVKLSGKLPALRLSASKENIRNLFKVLNAISSSDTTTALPRTSQQESRITSQQIWRVSQFLSNKQQTMKQPPLQSDTNTNVLAKTGDNNNRAIAVSNEISKQRLQKLAALDFEITEAVLVVYHKQLTESKETIRRHKHAPLVMIALQSARALLNVTNQSRAIEIKLKSFFVEDKFTASENKDPYLIKFECGNEVDEMCFRYTGIPRDSPVYNNIDHDIVVELHKLFVNFNRPTIAELLLIANDIVSTLDKQSQVSLPQPTTTLKNESQQLSELIVLPPPSKPNPNVSIAKVKVSLKSANINLNKEGKSFACSALNISTIEIDVREDKKIHISGSLGGITLLDPNTPQWSTLLSTSGDKIISFEFTKFDTTSEGYPGYDMALRLNLQSLKFVFLNRFIKGIAKYFLAFVKMKETLSMTTEALREAVAAGIQNVKAQRIKFDLNIATPHIIVPKNSQINEQYLTFDLGDITIANNFVSNRGVDFDEIFVTITRLNAKSVTSHTQTKEIIHNTNVKVKVDRVLSPNPQVSVANLKVGVDISDIQVDLTQHQSELIFGVLEGNLSEFVMIDIIEVTMIEEQVKKNEEEEENRLFKKQSRILPQSEAKYPARTTNTNTITKVSPVNETSSSMEVELRLTQVSLTIFKGTGFTQSGSSTALVQFVLQNLNTKLALLPNGKVAILASLKTVVLEDVRSPCPNKFKKLLSSPMIENNEPHLEFKFESNSATGMTTITINLNKPQIMFLADCILELKRLLLPLLERLSKSLNTWKEAVEKEKEMEMKPLSQDDKIKEIFKKEKQHFQQLNSVMDLKLVLKSPRIFVLEKPQEDESNAFIAFFGVSQFRMVLTGSRQLKLDLDLRALESSVTRIKAQADQLSVVIPILQPLNLALNMGNQNDLRKISVDIGVINTIISYKDIKLALAVLRDWQPLIDDVLNRTPSTTTVSAKVSTPSQTWKKGLTTKKELSTKKPKIIIGREPPPPSSELSPKLKEEPPSSQQKIDDQNRELEPLIGEDFETQKLIITLGGLNFCLLNDKYESNFAVPITRIIIARVESLASFTFHGKMEFQTQIEKVAIDAYNHDLCAYEPMLEPWGIELQFQQSRDKAIKLNIASDRILNINVSTSLLDMLYNTWTLLQEEDLFSIKKFRQSQHQDQSKVRQSFYPFTIHNETGQSLKFWWETQPEESAVSIPSGKQVPLEGATFAVRGQLMQQAMSYFGNVKIDDSSFRTPLLPILNLPVDKVGTHLRPLSKSDNNLYFVSEVVHSQGTKSIALRSNYKIVNETPFSIEVFIETATEGVAPYLLTIESGHSAAVPLQYLPFKALKYRPNDNFEWSTGNDILFCKNKQHGTSNTNANTNSALFWMCAITEEEIEFDFGSDHIITLYSPLIVENLLATKIIYKIEDAETKEEILSAKIPKGEQAHVFWTNHMSHPLNIKIQFRGFDWSESLTVFWPKKERSKATKHISIADSFKRTLQLSADLSQDEKSRKVSIYAPYWIINSSGLNLLYKSDPNSKKLSAGQQWQEEEDNRRKLEGDPRQWYTVLPHQQNLLEGSEQKEVSEKKKSTSSLELGRNLIYFDQKVLSFKIEDSSWSKAFSLGVQNEGIIELNDENSKRSYQFAVLVSPAPGKYWRTKLAKIYPGIILVNKTGKQIAYKQKFTPQTKNVTNIQSEEESNVFLLDDNEQVPFHWPNFKQERKLSVRYNQGDSNQKETSSQSVWSSGFKVDQPGHFQLKIPKSAYNATDHDLLNVHIKILNGTTFVIFGGQEEAFTYYIHNDTSLEIIIQQKGCEGTQKIAPKSKISYCWDEPQQNDKRLLLTVANTTTTFALSLDKIGRCRPAKLPDQERWLLSEIRAEGPVRTLYLHETVNPAEVQTLLKKMTQKTSKKTKEKKKKEVKEKVDAKSQVTSSIDSVFNENESEGASDDDDIDDREFVALERKVKIDFTAALSGIGISVIDNSMHNSKPQELLYATAQTIFFNFTSTNVDQSIEFRVGKFQIDNQLYLTPYSIVLWPHPVEGKEFVKLAIVKDDRYNTIQFLRYFAVAIQEMDISIDQTFLVQAMAFASYAQSHLNKIRGIDEETRLFSTRTTTMPFLSEKELTASNMFYFEMLHINPIKANISFVTTPKIINPNVDKTTLEKILGFVGAIANVERAPLTLNGLLLDHVFASQKEVIDRITAHYKSAVLKQVYKIIGSADFLGSPVNLVSNLGAGVHDFFYEPAKGIVNSPAQFGLGVAKGTGSLLKNTTYALFNTASKLTSTVAKVGETLTLDEDYKRERAIRGQKKAQHIGEGIVYGITDFTVGLYKGITGVVTEPIKGAQREGGVGFLKGVGRGLTGVILKPAVGAVDLITRTTEGIKNTTTIFDEKVKARIRPPRFFGSDNLITVFDFQASLGQEIMSTANGGQYLNEYYDFHYFVTKKNDVCVLGTKRLLLYMKQTLIGAAWEVVWAVPLSRIVNMRLKKNEIVLIVKLPHELAFIVECESKEICKEVLKKIYSALLIRGSLDNSQMMSIRNQINKELGGKEDIFVGMEIKTRSPVTGGRDSLNLQWQAIQKEKLKGLEQKVKGHKPRFTIGDRVSQSPQPQQPQPQQQQSQSQPQQPQPQSQSQQQPQQESIPPISQTTSQQTQSPTITFETFKQQPESINQSEEETCLQTTVTETTPLLGESNNQSKGQKKQRRCCC